MSILLDGTQGIDFNDGSNQSTSATPYGRKNLIINGDMRIAQRGTSSSSITTSGYTTVDRWTNSLGTAGTWTISQDTDVPTGQGFSNSHKYDCTTANGSLSAGSELSIIQMIEAQNLQHLKFGTSSAETLTVSFWVKSNKTGTYIFELYQWDDNRGISKSYTIDSADTWEKKTITIDADTTGVIDNNNDRGFQCAWWLVAGTNYTSGTLQTTWATLTNANRAVGQVNLADNTANYINITGLQLEVGDSASDFEFVPYDMELARCQRYYWKNTTTGSADVLTPFGEIYSSTAGQVALTYPVTMRTASVSVEWSNVTATVPSTGNYVVSSLAIANTNYNISLLTFGSSGMTAGKVPYLRQGASNGYIAISGEL